MTLRWPVTSLRARIGAIIALHVLLVVVLVRLLLAEPESNAERRYRLVAADDLAVAVESLEQTPLSLRPAMLKALSTGDHRASLLPEFPKGVEATGLPGDATGGSNQAARLSAYHAALNGRAFAIQTQGQPHGLRFSDGLLSRTPIRVLVRLRTGEILAIQRTAPTMVSRAASRAGLILGAVGALNILVILLLAAQTTNPVGRLVRAVQADSDDPRPRALDLVGPRELRDLASAFNTVRAKLAAMMEERTRMLAAVAHDFRTYLTRLQLRADYITDPRQRALALADIDEMTTLLNDTLTFAQVAAGPREPSAEIIDVLAETAKAVDLRRESGGDARLAPCEETILPTRVDRIAYRRMLANLIDNGVRYGEAVTVGLHRSEAWTVISVEDEGPGVPEAKLQALIEPFHRLEESRARHTGGAGLGLAIVHALALRQGGALTLENRREGGFRACLRLPIG